MTRQESFKRRVRARMAHTGERYVEARRVLLAQAEARNRGRRRPWVSEPEVADERLAAATGRGWDAWCDLIDAWPGHGDGHTAVATHLRDDHGVDGWWAQAVTVGWERITGRRLPHQRADGTFTISRSRTVTGEAGELRALLVDDDARAEVLPGLATELRSKPGARSLRIGIDSTGVALFDVEPRPGGRVKVTVAHERLATAAAVDRWAHFWTEWLEAIDDTPDTSPDLGAPGVTGDPRRTEIAE